MAVLGMVLALPAAATPCTSIDRILTPQQKQAWAPVIARQLRVARVDVLQVFRLDHWRIVYVDTHRSDNGFLFYREDPLDSRYIATWAGAAQPGEEASITQWTQTNAPGIPEALAQCFGWYVTQHRDS
ncbi:hypothetical protein GCM10007863_11740 [Dyella mobilis]|nr:hypothetical protein GCM10007863_11740 [Dyella mobilis]